MGLMIFLYSDISTHAPLAGRDGDCLRIFPKKLDFNPRAPCGARLLMVGDVFSSMIFQPTRPLRGATIFMDLSRTEQEFQPTRPLRGATFYSLRHHLSQKIFQPTRPLRGATWKESKGAKYEFGISTHAPLAGRDDRPRRFR